MNTSTNTNSPNRFYITADIDGVELREKINLTDHILHRYPMIGMLIRRIDDEHFIFDVTPVVHDVSMFYIIIEIIRGSNSMFICIEDTLLPIYKEIFDFIQIKKEDLLTMHNARDIRNGEIGVDQGFDIIITSSQMIHNNSASIVIVHDADRMMIRGDKITHVIAGNVDDLTCTNCPLLFDVHNNNCKIMRFRGLNSVKTLHLNSYNTCVHDSTVVDEFVIEKLWVTKCNVEYIIASCREMCLHHLYSIHSLTIDPTVTTVLKCFNLHNLTEIINCCERMILKNLSSIC